VKNLVFFLFLLLVAFAVAGYFFGWYQITGVPSGTSGQHRLQIDLNTSKIRDDLHRGGEKLADGIERVKESAEKTKEANAKPKPAKDTKPKAADGSFFEFLGRIGEKAGVNQ